MRWHGHNKSINKIKRKMEKITINLNFDLKGLDGETALGNVGQLLAGLLVGATKGDAIKHYNWALKLHNKEAIEVDLSDYRKIKSFVEENEQITLLAKAQILNALEDAKDKKSD